MQTNNVSPLDNLKYWCEDQQPEPICPTTSNPIYLSTGAKETVETDFIGSGASPLQFIRTYRSDRGGKWSHNHEIYGFNLAATINIDSSSAVPERACVQGVGATTGETYCYKYFGTGQTNDFGVLRSNDRKLSFGTATNLLPAADINDRVSPVTDAAGATIAWQVRNAANDSTERYDLTGRIQTVTSLNGLAQSYTYSDGTTGPNGGFILDANGNPTVYPLPSGLLIRVTDAALRSLQFGYNAKKQMVQMLDPESQLYRYEYDSKQNLTKVSYPDGKTRQYLYENAGFPNALTGILDENGSRYATYRYNAQGRAYDEDHATNQPGGPVEHYGLTYNIDVYGSPISSIVTDPLGTARTYNFTTILGVVKNTGVSQPGGSGCGAAASATTYDANGNVKTRTDFNGNLTSYTYDLTRNLETNRTEAVGTPVARNIGTTWHPSFRKPTNIAEPGRDTTNVYDSAGNLLSRTITDTASGKTRTWTFTYTGSGDNTLANLLKSVDGPRTDVADVTRFEHYPNGDVRFIRNALNHTTEITQYDTNGRPKVMTDPNGVVTSLDYWPRGWLKSRNRGGQVTYYDYDGAGQIKKVTYPDGNFASYGYDDAHRLTDIGDATGNRIHYTLDNIGNRTREDVYDNSGVVVTTKSRTYDALNRLWQDIGALNQTAVYEYDANGNLKKIDGPRTDVTDITQRNYDALNRLTTSTDGLNGVARYDYDTQDRLAQVQAPNGASTQYQYDKLGNLLKELSPDRGTVNYVYDAAGNLVQQTDARGIVSAYTYDALNRLTRIDYPGTSEDIAYTYDSGTGCTFGLGRLCALLDESGSTAYGYDAFGNLLAQTHTELNVAYSTRYTYDAGNRVTSVMYPDNRTVTYQRDVLGRITSVATTVNSAAVTIAGNRTYRPDGLLLGQSFGNGLNELRQYDLQGRLTYQSLASADTRLYAYDANGNLIGLQSLPLVGSYSYDALDRLNLDQRTTTATTGSAFTYDPNGNRQTENLGTYAYLANSNRLTSTPQGAITLDAAGNTLSDGIRSYTYNNTGHLSNVAGASYSYNAQRLRSRKIVGSQGTVYHYDTLGNLIAETDTAGVMRRGYVWADGQALAQIEPVMVLPPDIIVDNPQATFTGTWATSTSITGFYGTNYRTNAKGTGKDKATWALNVPTTGTYQVYARWVAASTHASNAPFTVKYSGGSQTLAINQRVSGGQWMLLGSFAFTAGTAGSVTLTDNANGTVIADAIKLTATTGGTTQDAIRYLHGDHLNTPRLATNSQAQVIWRWEGEAFGNTPPTGTVTINLRFPGQYFDAESGLHYNWNRYYDPKVGRYLTADPIGLAGGLNTYTYVDNNPLRWTDRLGLMGSGGYIYRPIICNGEWVAVAWERSAINPFGIQLCICYWRCKECKNPSAWSGNKYDLPSTTNFMIFDGSGRPGSGDGDIETGNRCLCTRKPGPEKKDQCCDK